MSFAHNTTDSDNLKRERIRRVIDDCICRRIAGETVTDDALIAAHRDLMPELGEQLRGLRLIQKAQRQFDDESAGALHGLRVRCPNCRGSVAIDGDTRLSHVTCSACGSTFGLVDDTHISDVRPFRTVGRFKLLNRLGVGAFGSVWRAHDTELDRRVAVKIPRKHAMDADEAEKFVREARTAAQLAHPNIVSVHEVGRERDCLYIVTDLVEGQELADWLASHQPTFREAAKLCAVLADALEHAHQNGVVHRDLKPSNIMIDTAGQPHVTDFGLARREAGEVTMTVEGKLLGTPAYMSPEQARGAAHEAGPCSDVYSLGVILYELLTGVRPFRGSTRMLIHQILAEDAPSPRRLNGRIPRDLETICLKCLEKDTYRRYQTASELADELRRFLTGMPIHARPVSSVARGWRWARRNPLLSTVGALAASLLLILAIAGPSVAIRQTAQAKRYRWRSYVSDMQVVQQAWESVDIAKVDELLERYVPEPGQEDIRGFEWFYLRRLRDTNMPTRSIPYDAPGHVAFSPDGTLLASVGRRAIRLWRCEDFRAVRTMEGGYLVKGVAFSPDSQWLATGDWDGALKLWRVQGDDQSLSVASNPIILSRDRGITYHYLAFSPNGDLLATNGGRRVPIWSVADRRVVRELEGHEDTVTCVAFSRDGTLATGSDDKTVRLWDASTGRQLAILRDHDVTHVVAVAFSPDGGLLASCDGRRIRLWNVATAGLVDTLNGHTNTVDSIAFSPDGKLLASAGLDGMVRLWDLRSREQTVALRTHSKHVSFSADGRRLAAAGANGTLRLWDLPLSLEKNTFESRYVDGELRGNALALWTPAGLPMLCDPSMELPRDKVMDADVSCIAHSPDGTHIASGTSDGAVILHAPPASGQNPFHGRHAGRVGQLAFSPDGKRLASVGGPYTERELKLWDVATGNELAAMDVFWRAYPVFSHDSRTLATVNEDRTSRVYSINLWEVTGQHLTTVTDQQEFPFFSLALSRDGTKLAAGSVFGEITVWDISEIDAATKILGPFRAHMSQVFGLAFSHDTSRLASCGDDHTIKLWDLSTGDGTTTLTGHRDRIESVAFSPDGATLASASVDGEVRLWRAGVEK